MARPHRVLVVLNTLGLGGAEVFAAGCATAMDRAKFAVSMCYFRGGDDLVPMLEAAAIPVRRLDARGSFDGRAFSDLLGHMRSERFDIVQTHLPYSGMVARVLGRLAGVKAVISTEQCVLDSHELRSRRLHEVTLGLADAVVCISQGVMDSLVEEGLWTRRVRRHAILRVIPNGVDVVDIDERARRVGSSMRAQLGLSPGDFVIGTVGRLAEQKAQWVLVEAMPQVLAVLPHAVLVIVGYGPLEARLRDLSHRLGVQDRVRFLGKRSDVIEVITAFDLFAFPSDFEGLGVVLAEALTIPLPVVATRIRGVMDIIEDGKTGLLVPRRDPGAFARAITSLAGDPARRAQLASEGRGRVMDRFSMRRVVKAYEDLYSQVLDGAS